MGAFHDDSKQYGQADTYRVERDHHQGFVVLEERVHKQHIYRQSSRAGHKRHHQHRQHTVLGILYLFRRHDSRYVTAKTHQHRYETTTVQTYVVHDPIHDIRLTRHVTGVLHEADEEEKDDDIRQERQDGSYAF